MLFRSPIPALNLTRDEAPLIGRMLMNLAVQLSILVGDAHLAARYAELMDDLFHMGQLIDDEHAEIEPFLALSAPPKPRDAAQDIFPLMHHATVQQVIALLQARQLRVESAQFEPDLVSADDLSFEHSLIDMSLG